MSTSVGFASGSGIASALATVTRVLESAPTNRVWLFVDHSGAHDGEVVSDAMDELLALKDRNLARLSLGIVMEREPDEADLLSGRLDAAKVRKITGKLFEPSAVSQYFVSGSQALASVVTAALGEAGVPAARIQIEHSTEESKSSMPAAGATAAPAAARETQVSFVMDGRRRSFTMRTDEESILDAAYRAGIELPYSCKAGVCATCRTKLVKGKVDLMENSALEDWELEQGFILACQALARTPEIELTYDEK